MSHYKSNVRDQVFNLFEVLGIDKAFGEGDYADLDADTAREMLTEMSRLAEGPVAESFVEGDRNPPVFDPETHSVKLPDSFKGRCARSSTTQALCWPLQLMTPMETSSRVVCRA